MIYSQLGHYSLILGFLLSIILLFYSAFLLRSNIKYINQKIFSLTSVQLFSVILSFLCLVCSFIISDFSNETVYNNSHSTKPIFYKISGTWGNHEGSLLLWLLVLTLSLIHI